MLFYLAKRKKKKKKTLSKCDILNENKKLFETMYMDIIVHLFLFPFSCPLLPNIEMKTNDHSNLHS